MPTTVSLFASATFFGVGLDKIGRAQKNPVTANQTNADIPVTVEPKRLLRGRRFQLCEQFRTAEQRLDDSDDQRFGKLDQFVAYRFDQLIDIGVFGKIGNRLLDWITKCQQFR